MVTVVAEVLLLVVFGSIKSLLELLSGLNNQFYRK